MLKRGSPNSGFAGMTPEARRAAQSRGGKIAQAKRATAVAAEKASDEMLKSLRSRQVGFWNDSPFSTFPRPQDLVDTKWSATERERVVRYLRAGKEHMAWMGYSWCRFECGINESAMGCWDLTDGVWYWPEGFAHYVEKHGVRPPQEFVKHVLARSR